MTDPIHCFVPISSVKVDDIDATLHLFSHPTGARLIYSEREDSNKTFAIAFPTVPTDDTGVFHILEHSVLCGSERYPLKDPFSEMLKSSLKTFLNAFTYPDKTVYPASTRCDKDYYNLIDVYMDSVFHPLVRHDPRIFRQEGWRYEIGEDGIEINGVVYSEMQGAYSSPYELGQAAIARLLYSGGSYGFDSGGDPDVIPSLSYEALCKTHEKCYHPSRAYIIIDGSLDLEETLRHIDAGLSGFDKSTPESPEINLGELDPRPLTVEYAADEGGDSKSRVVIAFRGLPFHNKNEIVATAVSATALSSGNCAPLKKHMLDGGYCEDLSLYSREEALQSAIIAELRGVPRGREEEARNEFLAKLAAVLDEGIPTDQIEAELSSMEFSVRERDFGSTPKGVVYALSMLDSWIYGGDPEKYLTYTECFRHLRSMIGTDYFTDLFRSLTGGECATVYLTPSSGVAEERRNKRRAQIDSALKDGIIDAGKIATESKELEMWQDETDSDEALSSLPTLSVLDIPQAPPKLPTDVYNIDGVKILAHPISTDGIVYAELYFDISDIAKEDIFMLSTLASTFGEVGTATSDANELRVRIKKSLGSLTVNSWQTQIDGGARLYLVVRISFLKSKEEDFVTMLPEILYTSDFTDRIAAKRLFVQVKERLKQMLVSGSYNLSSIRSSAKLSCTGAVTEEMLGISAYERMKEYDADPDRFVDRLCLWMGEATERFFTKERLTLGITASSGILTKELCERIIGSIKHGTAPGRSTVNILPLPKQNELILSPCAVGHSVFSGVRPTSDEDASPEGAFAVAGSILNYELLWNEIRVKGGAYGTGFVHRPTTGMVGYYSYRDPSIEKSADIYPGVGDLLRALAREDADLDKYIIGTVGDCEALTSPSQDGTIESINHLSGRTYEDILRTRRDMLSFNKADLLRIADELDSIAENAVLTVIADKKARERLGNRIDAVIEV